MHPRWRRVGSVAAQAGRGSIAELTQRARVFALSDICLRAAHYKYTSGAGAPRPQMAAHAHASSVSDGAPPSFWRGTSQLASNLKIVACLLVLTKMLA